MADAALEPDVEEIGKLGVLDVVVVGWVNGDVMDAAICTRRQVHCRGVCDSQTVYRSMTFCPQGCLGGGNELREPGVRVLLLKYCPGQQVCGGIKLGMTVDKREVMAIETTSYSSVGVEPASSVIVNRCSVEGAPQISAYCISSLATQCLTNFLLYIRQGVECRHERKELPG